MSDSQKCVEFVILDEEICISTDKIQIQTENERDPKVGCVSDSQKCVEVVTLDEEIYINTDRIRIQTENERDPKVGCVSEGKSEL